MKNTLTIVIMGLIFYKYKLSATPIGPEYTNGHTALFSYIVATSFVWCLCKLYALLLWLFWRLNTLVNRGLHR